MRKGRVNSGDLLAAAGGVLIYVSLGLDWFGEHTIQGQRGVTNTGWEIFDSIDTILVVVAAIGAALLLVALLAGGRAAEVWSFLTFAAGGVATNIVGLRLVAQPGANEQVDIESGAWLGLVACIAVALGGWMAMRADRSPARGGATEAAST